MDANVEKIVQFCVAATQPPEGNSNISTQAGIAGYRALTDADKALINATKSVQMINETLFHVLHDRTTATLGLGMEAPDQMWLDEGMKQIRLGFMCLIRSVAKPAI